MRGSEISVERATRKAHEVSRDSTSQHGTCTLLVHRYSSVTPQGQARLTFGPTVVNLLHGVHAAIGFSQQSFRIDAVLWTKRCSYAQTEQVFSANLPPNLGCQLVQFFGLLHRRFWLKSGSNNHELVATHAGYIVVPTAYILELRSKLAQHFVAFQMSVAVVNLFKTIQVTDHYCDGAAASSAAGQFLAQMEEE